MTPYQPKIDSQEFELANPVQSAASIGQDEPACITMRVWGAPAPLSWNTDSVFVYMIADLIAASGGSLAEELPDALVARFENSRRAMVAAKRIQTSILEFLACRPGQAFGAAILVHGSSNRMAAGSETARQALGLADPGQILIAEETRMRLKNLPGMEFRAVAPLGPVMGGAQIPLSELVWTTTNRDARVSMPPPAIPMQSEPAPPVGATRIVDSPFRSFDSIETDSVKEPTRSSEASAQDQTAEFASLDVNQSIPAESEVPNTDGLLDELQPPAGIGTRGKVIAGISALVVIAALAAVFYRPRTVARPAPPVVPPSTEPSQAPQANPPGLHSQPVQEPVTEPPPKTPEVKAPEVKPTPPPATLPSSKVAKTIPKKDSKPAEDQGVDVYQGFSAKDIPMLLKKANGDLGSGRYEDAEYEYGIVLKLQPSNPDALLGRHRLTLVRNKDQ